MMCVLVWVFLLIGSILCIRVFKWVSLCSLVVVVVMCLLVWWVILVVVVWMMLLKLLK